MRAFFRRLRTRLVLAALVFLAALTLAVVLAVRDSLLYSADNTARLSADQMLAQGQAALLEITRREAELSDLALRPAPADLALLRHRLDNLRLTPNTFAFVVDAQGRLTAVSTGRAALLFGAAAGDDARWLGRSLADAASPELRASLPALLAGESGVVQLELGGATMLAAYAPLPAAGWALGLLTPAAELTAGADALAQAIQGDINRTLQATLLTIAYFAALAMVGVSLVAGALTRPIQTLVAGTRAIAAGDLGTRLPAGAGDELGVLAGAFNQMAAELQARSADLLKLSGAVEQSGDIVFVTNRAGVIEYVNRAFETQTGYPRAEAVGQTPRLLKSGVHAEAFYAELWRTLLAGGVFRAEVVNRKKDGATYVEEKTIAPITDRQGVLTHFVSTGRDVTERRRAESALRASEER